MPQSTIILSFDMETDIGSWTRGQRGMQEGAPAILDVLAGHKVKATFLFTGREAQNHPDIVKRVVADGHEVGCHTMYHETIGEAVFEMPGDLFVLEEEVRHRLELVTQAVERIAGCRPTSFRAPRLFGSTTMINALEDLGYIVDSSLPAYFYGRDFTPYHPSKDDWTKPGGVRILEIPVFYDADVQADDPERRERDQWPMLRLHGAEHFADLCRRMLVRMESTQSPVLCIYLHPWEFAEMPRSIETGEAKIEFKPFLHVNTGNFALNALDELIETMMREGVKFTTMRDFAHGWRPQG